LSNQNTYKSLNVVDTYIDETGLQPPEAVALQLLKDRLPAMRMLDIGVGAGRTTRHFAPRVKEYVGVDYSEGMVAACRRLFPSWPFEVCDARAMDRFPDDAFDFVLFSFNGIDYIAPEERGKVFAEVARVGKPGGHFLFSTHNIQSVHRLHRLRHRFFWNPKKTAEQLREWALLRFVHNKGVGWDGLANLSHAVFNDGAHNFGLRTCYVKPAAQAAALKPHFDNVRVFRRIDGAEIKDAGGLDAEDDAWLYYLCALR